jgi:hypothetical protein
MLNVVNTTLDTMLDWQGFCLSNPGATKEQQGVHHLGGTTVWTDVVGQMKVLPEQQGHSESLEPRRP